MQTSSSSSSSSSVSKAKGGKTVEGDEGTSEISHERYVYISFFFMTKRRRMRDADVIVERLPTLFLAVLFCTFSALILSIRVESSRVHSQLVEVSYRQAGCLFVTQHTHTHTHGRK